MPLAYDQRGWSSSSAQSATCLSDKYEVIKEIGDGSFGSVALARVRTGGSHIAKRNTMVAVKTMKKTFDSFAPCLELREVIFLRSLQPHRHLVPALDIFLDPLSKKLHIAMEYMDGNLYQLMKARDHKPFDGSSVKSILFQILSGLEHIHDSDFFHRDIKPENILVSVSSHETGSTFKRYSQLVTPPSTPPTYTVKIADFGLAREIHCKLPYTTYVSTRWYRAPEVLLRAGEYSAPVDIWAVGAMAVEIATLKPLFPGSNEVDQVWRVCEIMGSPGNWVTKEGERVGGGKWTDGQKLAQRLGFAFPKMMPHGMDAILPAPLWSHSLRQFVTQCLMWDPNNRPTTAECLRHEYFFDAHDPVPRPKSANKLMNRKRSDLNHPQSNRSIDSTQSLSSKTSSWFRKSLIARESAPAVPQHVPEGQTISPRMSPVKVVVPDALSENKPRPVPLKRNTWTNGALPQGAPMPILPSIRPVSPLSNTVTARAHAHPSAIEAQGSGKIGRQLSLASHGNHYSDLHRLEAERALNGQTAPASPPSSHKEGFFSHLRKRARRLSGRHQSPMPGSADDLEANAGCAPWGTNRSSALSDHMVDQDPSMNPEFSELDKALNSVRYSLEAANNASPASVGNRNATRTVSHPLLKRHHSLPQGQLNQGRVSPSPVGSQRIRRGVQKPMLPADQYETPDEQEELLDEALAGAQAACARLGQQQLRQSAAMQMDLGFLNETHRSKSDNVINAPYPTPSPSGHGNGFTFENKYAKSQPIGINKGKEQGPSGQPFPTPPDDDNDWASAAAASILASGERWI